MASVRVAVRVRPLNQRERDMNAAPVVSMNQDTTRLYEKANVYKEFTFDHSYWSCNPADEHFATQEQVFNDLGTDVVQSAFEGYNACVFAYGQTGSGKTYTMMGAEESQGLIPRICHALFDRVNTGHQHGQTYRTEVSYFEIYLEQVKDLLVRHKGVLKVREHPKEGPYVEDLSKHLVGNYNDIEKLMAIGNSKRTTAETKMNSQSSRSHAIFTLKFVRAEFEGDTPSETVSKIHLVDLAGSERANTSGATGDRLKEGGSINKSLATLALVIQDLADLSTKTHSKKLYIPYRNSVLTWLLKDSLGGNSKTVMIATISPADCNYLETLSTLRYAHQAKNIINKPTVNEDPNVKLIRDLRAEIASLRSRLSSGTAAGQGDALQILQEKEAKEKVLTEEWAERWREIQGILQEERALALRKSHLGQGIVLDSDRPHLVVIDDDQLSTGITLYHLVNGETAIGTKEANSRHDIVVQGAGILPEHCVILLEEGIATLVPKGACMVNAVPIENPTRLSQGAIIQLGKTNMFRYNDPVEVAKLRREGSTLQPNLSRLSMMCRSTSDILLMSDSPFNADSEANGSQDRARLLEEQLQNERAKWQQEREKQRLEQELLQQKLVEAQKVLEERILSEPQYQRQLADGSNNTSGSSEMLQEEKQHGISKQEVDNLQLMVEGRRQEIINFVNGTWDTDHRLDSLSNGVELTNRLHELENEVLQQIASLTNQLENETNAVIVQNLEEQREELENTRKVLREHSVEMTRLDKALQAKLITMANNELQLARVKSDQVLDKVKSDALICNETKEKLVHALQAVANDLQLISPDDSPFETAQSCLSAEESRNDHVKLNSTVIQELASTTTEAVVELQRLLHHMHRSEGDQDTDSSTQEILVLQELQNQYALLKSVLEKKQTVQTSTPKRQYQSNQSSPALRDGMLSPIYHMEEGPTNEFSMPVNCIDNQNQYICMMCSLSPSTLPTPRSPSCVSMLSETSEEIVIEVPSYVLRGNNTFSRYEYEVRIAVGSERWSVLRRFHQFRELHLSMIEQYGDPVRRLPFPNRKLFLIQTEYLAKERRWKLENYIIHLLDTCSRIEACPLFKCRDRPDKSALFAFSTFFKKAAFESCRCSTR